jgi:excisionase family DNA binding protein
MIRESTNHRDELLTVADVQALLQIGRSHAYQLARDELPTYRVGRLLRVRRDDLEAWLEENLERRNA